MSDFESLRERLVRPAWLFEPAESERCTKETDSFFGAVKVAVAGETWPSCHERPMIPLLQLNLTELVFRPPGSEDVHLLTLFVDSETHPKNGANGTNWTVRAYSSLAKLVPLSTPRVEFSVKPLSLEKPALIEDYPCRKDLEEEVEDDVWDAFEKRHENSPGIKLGGWPFLLQSEISWAPFGTHPAKPQYVVQVHSMPEAGWRWGHNGCAYIGRGTNKGCRNEWTLGWQR